LGRQPQARLTRWRKRRPLSRSSPRVSPVRSACNARSAPLPNLGSTCGRREREADDEYPSGSNPRGLVIATVEGTWFGGSRRPSRGSGRNRILAGPSRSHGSLPMRAVAPATTGAPRICREGERRRHVARSACTRRGGYRASRARGHVLGSVLGPVHVDRHSTPTVKAGGGDASRSVSRSGKSAQAEGTGTEVGTGGRCAARRASPLPKKKPRDASEKEGGRGLRPCEDRRARVEVPARRKCSCRSR
jgi:hypothetical protein